jgi:hypothetical protein
MLIIKLLCVSCQSAPAPRQAALEHQTLNREGAKEGLYRVN